MCHPNKAAPLLCTVKLMQLIFSHYCFANTRSGSNAVHLCLSIPPPSIVEVVMITRVMAVGTRSIEAYRYNQVPTPSPRFLPPTQTRRSHGGTYGHGPSPFCLTLQRPLPLLSGLTLSAYILVLFMRLSIIEALLGSWNIAYAGRWFDTYFSVAVPLK